MVQSMAKKKRTKMAVGAGMMALLLGLGICAGYEANNTGYKVSEMKSTYCLDVNDMSAVVGDVDYVFVGKVEKNIDTVYKYPVEVKGETVTTPYTNYSVSVIKDIKGDLPEGKTIEIQKAGGISEDGKTYFVYENDVIVDEGGYYVMLAYAQPDGSLLMSGANSTLKTGKLFKDSKIFQKVEKSYLNEKKTERKRFKFLEKK